MKTIFRSGIFALIFLSIVQFSYAQGGILGGLLGGGLSEEETGKGLKEALVQGITKAALEGSKKDGYFGNPNIKIPFPEKTIRVAEKLRQMGLGGQVDAFVLALNRGAEEAAKEAVPIFGNAIGQLKFQDVFQILRGQENAATQYLQGTTTQALKTAFTPIVKKNLDKVNATKLYAALIKKYNKLPMVTKAEPDLEDYATDKAIEGLFKLVAGEEKNIRTNANARTSELLKKVFGSK